MGKLCGIWLVVLLLVVIGGIVWLVASSLDTEPYYQGKRLSVWVAELDKEMPASNFSGTNGPAATAIQEMGTNAIPYLRALLQVKDSRVKTALTDFCEKHPWLRIHLTPDDVWWRRATSGAFCLGPQGSALMPDIIEMFRSADYRVAFAATETMGRMGYCNPETIPAVLAAVQEPTNGLPGFHDRASLVFMQLSQSMEIVHVNYPNAFHDAGYKAVVPVLLKALNASNDVPLCLGMTLKPCCRAMVYQIDPEWASQAGVW